MAILLILEIPSIERELCLHEILCESLILRRSWVLCSFCPRRNQKTYEQVKEMFSGFSAKTRTSVNGFPHADPAVRARTHPTRASVQRPLRGYLGVLCKKCLGHIKLGFEYLIYLLWWSWMVQPWMRLKVVNVSFSNITRNGRPGISPWPCVFAGYMGPQNWFNYDLCSVSEAKCC